MLQEVMAYYDPSGRGKIDFGTFCQRVMGESNEVGNQLRACRRATHVRLTRRLRQDDTGWHQRTPSNVHAPDMDPRNARAPPPPAGLGRSRRVAAAVDRAPGPAAPARSMGGRGLQLYAQPSIDTLTVARARWLGGAVHKGAATEDAAQLQAALPRAQSQGSRG